MVPRWLPGCTALADDFRLPRLVSRTLLLCGGDVILRQRARMEESFPDGHESRRSADVKAAPGSRTARHALRVTVSTGLAEPIQGQGRIVTGWDDSCHLCTEVAPAL